MTASLSVFVIVFVIVRCKICQNKKSYLRRPTDTNNGSNSDDRNDLKQPLLDVIDDDNNHDEEKLEFDNIELEISNGYVIAGDKRIPLKLLTKAIKLESRKQKRKEKLKEKHKHRESTIESLLNQEEKDKEQKHKIKILIHLNMVNIKIKLKISL